MRKIGVSKLNQYEPDLKTFNGRVKAIRKHLGLTQKKFSEKLNITHQAISDIEKGSSKPGYEFFFNITNSYNVDLDFLLNGTGDMFKSAERKKFPMIEDNEYIQEFFKFFFKSQFFRVRILGEARKVLIKEREIIEMELGKTIEELKSEAT